MANHLKKICWRVTLFLILNPLISAVALVLYFVFSKAYTSSEVLWISVFALVFALFTNLSITMGYHRLWSHKTFEAHPLLEKILLLISAGAFQGSALKWASDHRIHHRFEDTDRDPYNINRGFWHAHMGWMMKHETVSLPINAPDLAKNKWIKNQHDNYWIWSLGVGFIFPMFIGHLMGNAFLGLFIAGGLRIFLTQQSTFLVNSLSHTHGRTSYSSVKSARDSILVAVLTHGEGYHNFHHKFQFDYRNGIRWYHWDPTKWCIGLCSLLGLAWDLRRTSDVMIVKARLQADESRLISRGVPVEHFVSLRKRVVDAAARFREMQDECRHLKVQYREYQGQLREQSYPWD